MILKIYRGNDCKPQDLVKIYGGYFDFDYSPADKRLRVTSQTETKSYPCVKMDFSVGANIGFAFAGSGYKGGKTESSDEPF